MAGDRIQRVSFPGATGANLDARLDLPESTPRGFALVAHCFTCSKDLVGIARISRALTAHGWAVMRFDFTGLGSSEGEFGNTDFSSNIGDLVAAASWLRTHHAPPTLLIGHSLGGSAVIRAAEQITEARAICTINAPFDPANVLRLLGNAREVADREGVAEVTIAQRSFRISRGFLDDIEEQPMLESLRTLGRPLLIFHAPTDKVVALDNARLIFEAAKHPKSFLSLDGADHLLTRDQDAVFVASMLATWAERYVPAYVPPVLARLPEVGHVEVAELVDTGKFAQQITVGKHTLRADEPESFGGTDTGPSPYDLLTAALGACTSMTLRMYADRKGWPLERATVQLRHGKVHAKDCEDCATEVGKIDVIERTLVLEGPLDEEMRSRLIEIADRCPVHRTLEGEVKVRTRLKPGE